jgi:hypothetical protein
MVTAPIAIRRSARALAVLCLGGAGLLVGCSTFKQGPTGRAASDQFLISACIDDAVDALRAEENLRGRKTLLRLEGFKAEKDSVDEAYLREALRAWIIRNGAVPTDDPEQAELRLTALVQSVGSDILESAFRLPLPLPSLQTGLVLADLVLYMNRTQLGRCHLWLYGVDEENRLVFSHPSVSSRHYIRSVELLGFSIGRWTDLKALRSKPPQP